MISITPGTIISINGEIVVGIPGGYRSATPEEVAAYQQQRADYHAKRAQYHADRAARKANGTAGPDIVIGDVARNIVKVNIRIQGED
jgi:hypothetical protein